MLTAFNGSYKLQHTEYHSQFAVCLSNTERGEKSPREVKMHLLVIQQIQQAWDAVRVAGSHRFDS